MPAHSLDLAYVKSLRPSLRIAFGKVSGPRKLSFPEGPKPGHTKPAPQRPVIRFALKKNFSRTLHEHCTRKSAAPLIPAPVLQEQEDGRPENDDAGGGSAEDGQPESNDVGGGSAEDGQPESDDAGAEEGGDDN